MFFETDWLSIYRFKTPNIGDIMCSPRLYFNLPKNDRLDILESDFYNKNNCIVGGGGIIHFRDRIKNTLSICKSNRKKMIIWGAGHNVHKESKLFFPQWLKDVDIVGLRDSDTDFEWVPCASCMHPIFDQKFSVVRDFSFYGHYAISNNIIKFEVFNNEDFSKVINYLGGSEYVITNTYHGVYWATLLGKKVLAYPFSTKFYSLKHPPVLLNNLKHWSDKLSSAIAYPNALEECRNANIEFYAKCKRLFD